MNANIVVIDNNIFAIRFIREKLILALMNNGYGVTVLTNGSPEQMQLAKKKCYDVIDIGSSVQNPLDILRYLLNMYKAIRRLKPDLCLTFTIRPAIWGNIITRFLKIPTITNITGIGPLFKNNNIAYIGARILYKFALKKSAKIFFQNYDDMNIFIEKGFICPGSAERIPGSGVDHEHYLPGKRKKTGGNFNYIFISRLVRDKGVREYVEAARLLKKELPDTEFSILGPLWQQNLRDNTVTEAELGSWVKDGVINYLGDAADVRDFIVEADCVVLPSYREGSSNILLEASSMERPCITCNTTGCKEIVEDGVTGYLCNIRDALDLADKMRKMYYLPGERRAIMGKNAREKVIREFDKKIVLDAYLKTIRQIIEK